MSEMGRSHFVDKFIKIKEKRGMKSSKFLRKKSSVLMLSGGIDSVAGLKYLLVETDKLLYVHHIHLKNDEGIEYSRYKKEAEAVRKIVPYMKKTFRNFNYTESTIDVRQIVGLLPDYYEEEDFSLSNLGFVSDRLWWGLIAGLMSKITNSYEIHVGSCVEDETEISFADDEYSIENQREFIRAPALSAASYPHEIPSIAADNFTYNTKRQNIEYLGKELMNMVWYCRQPMEKNGEFVACHECKSCIHVDNALL